MHVTCKLYDYHNYDLQELFVSKILPTLEGELYFRDGKKSSWKKHMFVLRASGLYYSRSGKSLASKDIVRVVEWKDVECYTGSQYKKFYRAPGNYCFSIVVGLSNIYSPFPLLSSPLLPLSSPLLSSPLPSPLLLLPLSSPPPPLPLIDPV